MVTIITLGNRDGSRMRLELQNCNKGSMAIQVYPTPRSEVQTPLPAEKTLCKLRKGTPRRLVVQAKRLKFTVVISLVDE